MQQPSAQGIASLYRGNPQPLQQVIQKEQQAKPGLPPDLQKLLALQIVNNEKDGFAAQKAMEQLQQMGGAQGGKPPTVMQSLQQQAEQKLQAQAVQAQQKQQGIQSLMQQVPASGVPAGTPQPDAQPEAQGIDQLPAEFDMAEGGIVAFAKGGAEGEETEEYETRLDKLYRENREDAARPERKKDDEGIRKALAFLAAPLAAAGDVVAAPVRGLYGMTQHGGVSMTPLMDARARFLASSENAPAAESAVREVTAPQAAPTPVGNRAAINAVDAATRAAPAEKPAPKQIVNNLKALAEQRGAAPKPAAPAVPVAATPAPAVESAAMNLVKARMAEKPEDREAAAMAKYEKLVGKPDTAQHDRLIAELEKRKQSLEPKQGFEGLMEYLGQVSANSQPGRGSFASGAAGARGMDTLNKERALQQFELSKQAIEVSQKKLDTVRAYAKDVYGVGKTAFDQVYKDQFDAAKEVVKDEAEAKKLAQENTLKTLQMQNNLDVQRLQNQGSLAVANARGAGAGGDDKQQLSELKALQSSLATQMKTTYKPAERQVLQAKLNQVEAAIAKMAGLDTMGAAPGAASPGGTSTTGWGKAQVVNP